MSEGTKFFACEACHDRGCGCYPEGDATTFRRDYTGYVSGSSFVTVDEDGDPDEGDVDFDSSEVYDYGEGGSYSCSCCGHEYYRLDANNGLVVLWLDHETDAVALYDGQDEDEDDEDEEDDVSVPEFTLTNIPDDGKPIDVVIAFDDSLTPRETTEVEIVQLQ